MMHSREADKALPTLLDWLVVQSPLYPDVLEAIWRAGERALELLSQRIAECATKGDDEAVRNMLDLGSRLPDAVLPQVVLIAIGLLASEKPDIREAAADAISRIALPYGRPAAAELRRVAVSDRTELVRRAAKEALVKLGVILQQT